MQPVSLALFWHQHQPYYPDDVSDETLMPWVRLHGTKDYIGMALHIKEVPEFHCTINLVPSLLVQIQRYVDGHTDKHLDISTLNADALTEADSIYLLDHFFMANENSMIRPFARYHELHQRRSAGRDTAVKVLPGFNTQDLRDLQVCNNLTWFHGLLFENDSELRKFRDKGKDWTESEKLWLLSKQREVMGNIIPLHRELMEGGQVELTTTPFYHPILPLLWDKKSAREAMPGTPMPKYVESYKEDAMRHLKLAVKYHTELFGVPPRGLWPSEGSVSQDIIGAIVDCGIEWIATDEEILTHSTDGFVHRDGNGLVNRPEMLYRPWRLDHQDKSLQIIFRDHGLSDLIGFHYQRNDPRWAADDLLRTVKEIGRAVASQAPDKPALVPIVLDGENCWEYFADGGVGFLRNLYRQAAADPMVAPVRVSEHLAKNPAVHKINRLFAGSWINHDFYIWIGHQEDRDAWDLVHTTRDFLKRAEKTKTLSEATFKQAWDELFIAQGSDWYWWYGDDHNSEQDDLFDELFRRHLRNVYTLLGEAPPSILYKSVTSTERRQLHTQPRSFINIKVDGRASYFEWLHAGHYQVGSERGTMTMVSDSIVTNLYFGFNIDQFVLRLDTLKRAQDDLKQFDAVHLRFVEPFGTEVRIDCKHAQQSPTIVVDGKESPCLIGKVAIGKILELSIPWEELKLQSGQRISFAIELMKTQVSLDRTPTEGTIDLAVPTPDFELQNWQA